MAAFLMVPMHSLQMSAAVVRSQNLIRRFQHGAFAGSPIPEPRGAVSAAGRACDPGAARAVACPPRAQMGTQLRLGAAPCGLLTGFLSVFGLSMHVANVGVAGSSPVSCSSFLAPATGYVVGATHFRVTWLRGGRALGGIRRSQRRRGSLALRADPGAGPWRNNLLS
jgi:hypothetical protein